MHYDNYDSLVLEHENSICYIARTDNYELQYLNKNAMKMFNFSSPQDYEGKKCYKTLQGKDAPCDFCTNDKLVSGEKYCWEHYNEKLGRWLSLEDTLLTIEGHPCRMEYGRDITDQKAKFQRLSDQLSLEEILLECIKTLATEDDVEMAFGRFLERLGRYYRAVRAYIFEFDFENNVTSNTYEWCAPAFEPQINNLKNIPLDYISGWMAKFRQSGEFFISSLDQYDDEPEIIEILRRQGITSLLAAPLYADGTIVGFVGVDDPTNSIDNLTLLKASSNFVVEELKKRRLIEKLRKASYTDLLTGLYNRNKYTDVLEELKKSPPLSLGVIFADVNGLKNTNDTYGHRYGDALLVKASHILRDIGGEHTYRMGGDEFVVLMPNISAPEFEQRVARLKSSLVETKDSDMSLGCLWDSGDLDVGALVMEADKLMYVQKQSYYEQALKQGLGIRAGLVSQVTREIEQGRFVVYYQPQINIKTGQVIGAEALVRKRGEGGELILPASFLPHYELEGVIRYIDLFVLEQVCSALEQWRKEGVELSISVNISPVTLMETDIVENIRGIYQKHGVSPKSIALEISQSLTRLTQEQLKGQLSRLAELGFTIALDDFGTKYSSLTALDNMDFDTVKIDRTLVERLEESKRSRIIVKNTIRMCREIDSAHTVAEGVETKAQMQLLTDYDCEFAQGYYFSRPLPLDSFNRLLDGDGTLSTN